MHALDDTTLVVELEHPCPYFLELISHPIYSPVDTYRVNRLHPNWLLQSGPAYICNGPFMLHDSTPGETYVLTKNPLYWDEKKVQLDRIHITKVEAQQAKEMFEEGELDWLGRPLRAWEPFFSQQEECKMEQVPVTSTFWCTD